MFASHSIFSNMAKRISALLQPREDWSVKAKAIHVKSLSLKSVCIVCIVSRISVVIFVVIFVIQALAQVGVSFPEARD